MLARALGARRNDVLVATKVGNRNGPGPNDVGPQPRAPADRDRRVAASARYGSHRPAATARARPAEPLRRYLADSRRRGQGRQGPLPRLLEPVRMAARQGPRRRGRTGPARRSPRCRRTTPWPAVISSARSSRPSSTSSSGLLSWCPLAGGLLTGKFTRSRKPADASRRLTFDFPPVAMERAYDVIDVLETVATRHEATVAQVALAWQFRQPAVTSAIVGARSAEQLAENVKADCARAVAGRSATDRYRQPAPE